MSLFERYVTPHDDTAALEVEIAALWDVIRKERAENRRLRLLVAAMRFPK